MATHQKVHKLGGTFFCTFTCYKWLHLFELSSSYGLVYNWMRIAQSKGVQFHGYVIMPNHVHLLLTTPSGLDLNKLFSNGKRFMAYSMLPRLKDQKQVDILKKLKMGVRAGDKNRGQKHRVFSTTTDIRECDCPSMADQKLDYIHGNPVSDNWALANSAEEYAHSSAGFYEGKPNEFIQLVHLDLAEH